MRCRRQASAAGVGLRSRRRIRAAGGCTGAGSGTRLTTGRPGASAAERAISATPRPAPTNSRMLAALCVANEARARELLTTAWTDPLFVAAYADWAAGVLDSQRAYHARVARRSHVLQHRIHRVTTALFVMTALGALAHLVLHTRWISMITTVFPALAAAMHGALAQSEAYRLEAASERVALELQKAAVEIRAPLLAEPTPERLERVKTSIRDAVALILQEHQDWYMLVRPHHLPLG